MVNLNSLKAALAVAALVALDQVTKAIARRATGGISLLFVRIVNVGNNGSVFGLWEGSQKFLIGLSSVLILALLLLYRHLERPLQRVAFILMLSGIVGNGIDRAAFGRVTDFISVPFWPAFNLADSFIFIGAAIMLVSILPLAAKKTTKKKA